jgi:hypothetical protein
MLELEVMLNDLNKMYGKEKGLRARIYLENAISNLKEYSKVSAGDAVYSRD